MLVAGLRGGSGKTLVSLGLIAAWRRNGKQVAPFKKGPDYIDAAWLAAAAGEPCRNMDLYIMSRQGVLHSIAASREYADVAVIEGNRGLYDGMDAKGSFSTAELAKLLSTPVVLAVDCTKSTRTIAALVLGCMKLDPEVPIAGVVLNQIAGTRHESVVRAAVEEISGVPVVGVVPRIREQIFPERHLGLIPPEEHGKEQDAIDRVAEVGERYLDIEALWRIARDAPALELPEEPSAVPVGTATGVARIGVFRDAAFQFYYPENLEALKREGAVLVEISPLTATEVPDVDALYVGGGFPETLAPALADNSSFLQSVRSRVERGMPVYAECGGAVFLGETLHYTGREYELAGVLPITFVFRRKPQGHGYVELETVAENPFYGVGESLRGHEFHYTQMQSDNADELSFAFKVRRGVGFGGEKDGICRYNVLATYTHVHALGTAGWAPAVVQAAVRFRGGRQEASNASGSEL